jgi:hypothetical protein
MEAPYQNRKVRHVLRVVIRLLTCSRAQHTQKQILEEDMARNEENIAHLQAQADALSEGKRGLNKDKSELLQSIHKYEELVAQVRHPGPVTPSKHVNASMNRCALSVPVFCDIQNLLIFRPQGESQEARIMHRCLYMYDPLECMLDVSADAGGAQHCVPTAAGGEAASSGDAHIQ